MTFKDYIPWLISLAMLIVAIITLIGTRKKDTKSEIREEDNVFGGIKESLLKANMKLDQVCSTTNETRTDIKALSKDISALDLRLTAAERDLKTLFKQIEEIKKG